jgi:hypothetical protein
MFANQPNAARPASQHPRVKVIDTKRRWQQARMLTAAGLCLIGLGAAVNVVDGDEDSSRAAAPTINGPGVNIESLLGGPANGEPASSLDPSLVSVNTWTSSAEVPAPQPRAISSCAVDLSRVADVSMIASDLGAPNVDVVIAQLLSLGPQARVTALSFIRPLGSEPTRTSVTAELAATITDATSLDGLRDQMAAWLSQTGGWQVTNTINAADVSGGTSSVTLAASNGDTTTIAASATQIGASVTYELALLGMAATTASNSTVNYAAQFAPGAMGPEQASVAASLSWTGGDLYERFSYVFPVAPQNLSTTQQLLGDPNSWAYIGSAQVAPDAASVRVTTHDGMTVTSGLVADSLGGSSVQVDLDVPLGPCGSPGP